MNTNPHEARNRSEKARAIAALLWIGYTHSTTPSAFTCAELAASMTSEQRRDVALSAGQNPPSSECWNEIIAMLAEMERTQTRVLAGVV